MKLAQMPLLATALAFAGCATHRSDTTFVEAGNPRAIVGAELADLIEMQQGSARSLNSLALVLHVPKSLKPVGPRSRRTKFGSHPYFVTLAAFLGDSSAIMMHAERVEDASGASNYDDLPKADWPDSSYRLRSFCVSLPASEIEGEHDLKFLRDAGWNPAGTIAMDQFLRTTDDHNEEVVISVLVRGVDCAKPGYVQTALKRARQQVSITTP